MNLQQTTLLDAFTLFYDPADESIGRWVARTGSFEPYECQLFCAAMQAGDSVVDVGANIGVYSLQAAQKVGAHGKVYAFEPEPHTFAILARNIEANGFENIETFAFALGKSRADATLYLGKENRGDHRLFASPDHADRESIRVHTERLDDVLLPRLGEGERIAVLKIDTQGYEPFVLKGAEQLIRRDRPTLLTEYWPYGYEEAGADREWMVAFLWEVYGEGFLVDGWYNRLKPLDREDLDYFRRKLGEWDGYRNWIFFGRRGRPSAGQAGSASLSRRSTASAV